MGHPPLVNEYLVSSCHNPSEVLEIQASKDCSPDKIVPLTFSQGKGGNEHTHFVPVPSRLGSKLLWGEGRRNAVASVGEEVLLGK